MNGPIKRAVSKQNFDPDCQVRLETYSGEDGGLPTPAYLSKKGTQFSAPDTHIHPYTCYFQLSRRFRNAC